MLRAPSYALLRFLLPVLLLASAGCFDEPSSVSEEPPPLQSPKPGSAWTFARHVLDSSGSTVLEERLTAAVRETGMTFRGESGLHEVYEETKSRALPVYLRYQANGDVLLYHPLVYPLFITLPVGSKTRSAPLPTLDTSYVRNGVYNERRYEGEIRYAGSGSEKADGQEVMVEKTWLSTEWTTVTGNVSERRAATIQLEYAPSLGYFTYIGIWVEEPPFFPVSSSSGESRFLLEWQLER